jgi:hypothetical protein
MDIIHLKIEIYIIGISLVQTVCVICSESYAAVLAYLNMCLEVDCVGRITGIEVLKPVLAKTVQFMIMRTSLLLSSNMKPEEAVTVYNNIDAYPSDN